MFRDCRARTIKRLLSHLKKMIFLPKEIVCMFGESAKEMFLIQRGEFEVIEAGTKEVVRTLKPGMFFGEMALLTKDARRTATIRSTGYSDALTLGREVFRKVADNSTFPDRKLNS